ncbi:hypothetical protein [Micromonospora sp. HUAS LYJ1]|uniref:hypothetical protein n=1 Tax=Micromonospora sp. HUAS LYJ1 TaxID=3061626 RepID=UPI002673565A|nr:hypothetical protein [Micromonospora sp. HUAS LYJ1]WKU06986.1 hypothetical protein Q2K16_08015 [Micromonospora sp. HUAS LYJ1]
MTGAGSRRRSRRSARDPQPRLPLRTLPEAVAGRAEAASDAAAGLLALVEGLGVYLSAGSTPRRGRPPPSTTSWTCSSADEGPWVGPASPRWGPFAVRSHPTRAILCGQ